MVGAPPAEEEDVFVEKTPPPKGTMKFVEPEEPATPPSAPPPAPPAPAPSPPVAPPAVPAPTPPPKAEPKPKPSEPAVSPTEAAAAVAAGPAGIAALAAKKGLGKLWSGVTSASSFMASKLKRAPGAVSAGVGAVAEQAGYAAPAGRVWAQPAVVLAVAFFTWLFLRFTGRLFAVANWILIAAAASFIFGVVFKEPKKGYIILSLPAFLWILDSLKMLTSANTILAVGVTATLVLVTFEKTREFAGKVLTILVFVLGGILIFWLSAWAQMQINIPFPFIITTTLMIGYFIFVLTKPGKLKWLALFANFVFFFVIFVTPTVIFLPDTPMYNVIDNQRQGWIGAWSLVAKSGKQVVKGFETQYYMALGDYEYGVEAQSEKPLGVFLENPGTTARIVEEGEKVDVFATLRVESFSTGENLSINVKCYVEGRKKLKGNITQGNVFSILERESQPIDCIMSSGDIGTGTPEIALEASFEFVTSAFLKTYFMEKEAIRSFRRQQLDPLDAFKIADKSPVAVFTGGPLSIGMGVGEQPVSLVEEEFGPTLAITFDRNWLEGQLWNITRLGITVPPGLSIDNIGGHEVALFDCEGGEKVEQTCTLEGEVLKDLFEVPVDTPKTIRVQTRISSIPDILANAPLAVRSFKVTAKYNYLIKKKVGMTIRAKEVKAEA